MDNIDSTDEAPDLVINFKGNKIPVHKSVLIEASEYFRTMLTKDFKEADQNEIDIEFDVNVEIFRAIINYIYTDEIEFSTNNVEDISKIAKYFMLENLMKSSFDFKVKFFERILKNESFLDWELSKVQEVLQSDRVVVSNEKKMLLFATKWMKYDFVNRCKSAVEILQNVRFSRITNEERQEIAGKFMFGIPTELSIKPTQARQYHKGIYMFTEDYNVEQYCPIDGSVTRLPQRPFGSPDSQRNFEMIVNNEKIHFFYGREYSYYNGYKQVRHVYDPLTDIWTKQEIPNPQGTMSSYCSFGGEIFAFCLRETITVFQLEANHWVNKSESDKFFRQDELIQLSDATVCGDSIYLFEFKSSKIIQYKPSTGEWTITPYSYKLGGYDNKIVAYKTKLIFNYDDKEGLCMVVYDTVAKDFTEYFCCESPESHHIVIYNDSMYFIPRQYSGYTAQVKQFDISLLYEGIAHEESLPVLKTQLHHIDHIAVIQ